MKLRVTRIYEITTDLTQDNFINYAAGVWMRDMSEPMEPRTLHHAAVVATWFFDQGDMTDVVDEYDHSVEVIQP